MVNYVFTNTAYASSMVLTAFQRFIERCLVIGAHLLVAALCLSFAQPAFAQSTATFSTTATGTVGGATDCANPLLRTINVGPNFLIFDVNIGILATHTWRGDIQITLVSPSGTRVRLTNGDSANLSGENFNVLLDDSAGQVVNTDGNTTNHSTTAPPYQNTFSPNNPLSAFIGESSGGQWQLEMCDLFPSADDGTFLRADLILTSVPSNFADLSLAKSLIGSPPVQGGTATYRLTVTNADFSTETATGIVVRENFPAAFTFASSSGDGSFNPANNNWSVPNLAPGQSASITLRGSISAAAGSTVTNTAEIIAANELEADSTVNNGVTGEDDFASNSFTVQSGRAPGVPPILACPVGQSVFDWDAIPGWTAGSTDNSYNFGNLGDVRFQITNTGNFVSNANLGGQSPTVHPIFPGGLPSLENSLVLTVNQPDVSGEVVLVITLPRAITGLQFTVSDIDFLPNGWADLVEVTGSNGGLSVNPQLTNGNVNFVSGNSFIGDGGSGNDPLGNGIVTFTEAVDTITLRYANHTTAPADPANQLISIHDLYYCTPDVNLTVSKVSSIIADPINGATDPKAIPGATVEYLITVTNTGVDATFPETVSIIDNGPADARMCLIARAGGPIIFNDPGSNSNLSYTFASLGSTADDVEFSNDGGASFNYTPVDDGTGCDPNITDFRVMPGGTFSGSANFTITVRYEIE